MPASTVQSVHFPDKLRLRVPKGLPVAVQLAARQQNTSPAEWARRALLKGLEADGLALRDGTVAPTSDPASNCS